MCARCLCTRAGWCLTAKNTSLSNCASWFTSFWTSYRYVTVAKRWTSLWVARWEALPDHRHPELALLSLWSFVCSPCVLWVLCFPVLQIPVLCPMNKHWYLVHPFFVKTWTLLVRRLLWTSRRWMLSCHIVYALCTRAAHGHTQRSCSRSPRYCTPMESSVNG